MVKHSKVIALLLLVAMFGGIIGLSQFSEANAGNGGPKIQLRAIDQTTGEVRELVFVDDGVKTPVGVNTPQASSTYCGLADFETFKAQVVLTGTLSGTAPTLAVKWQNSMDGGATWTDVGTWTTINATVTPATQSQTVSDVWNNTTAVAYGDCWRATYTFGGTSPTGNFSIRGIAENHD